MRGVTSGGPYKLIVSGSDFDSWLDLDVTNGTTYYYVVSNITNGVEGPKSMQATATPSVSPTTTVLFNEEFGDSSHWTGTNGPYVGSYWNQYLPMNVPGNLFQKNPFTLGNTEWGNVPVALTEPSSAGTVAFMRMKLSTYNPDSTYRGNKFSSAELQSNIAFSIPQVGQALEFETRMRLPNFRTGLVAAPYLYAEHIIHSLTAPVTLDDEIDFEYLGGGGSPATLTASGKVQITAWHDWERYNDATHGYGVDVHPGEYPNGWFHDKIHHNDSSPDAGVDRTQWHYLKVRWAHLSSGFQTTWYAKQNANDVYKLIGTETGVQPTAPLAIHLNLWAPNKDLFPQAWDQNFVPTTSSSANADYFMDVDSYKVTSINVSGTTSTSSPVVSAPSAPSLPPPNPPATSNWKALDISTSAGNTTSLLWLKSDNSFQVWNINDAGVNTQDSPVFAPITGSSGNWTPKRVGVGGDGLTRVLMVRTDGAISIWTLSSILGYGSSSDVYGPITGWSCQDMSVLSNNSVQLLWTMSDGHFSTWNWPAGGNPYASSTFGPYSDPSGSWSARKIGISGGDGLLRILVNRTDGCSVVWKLNPDMTFGSQSGGYGPFVQDSPFTWSAAALALNTSSNSDNKRNLVWVRSDNRAQFWRLPNDDTLPIPQSLEVNAGYGPFPYGSYANCTPQAMSVGNDGQMRVLWTRGDSSAALWKLSPDGNSLAVNVSFGPLP